MDGLSTTFDQVLGRLVASLRFSIKLNQADFARRCRMHPRTLSRIESGGTVITAAHLVMMDRAFSELFPHFEQGDLVSCVEAVIFDIYEAGGRVVRRHREGVHPPLASDAELSPFIFRVVGEEGEAARRAEQTDQTLMSLVEDW